MYPRIVIVARKNRDKAANLLTLLKFYIDICLHPDFGDTIRGYHATRIANHHQVNINGIRRKTHQD